MQLRGGNQAGNAASTPGKPPPAGGANPPRGSLVLPKGFTWHNDASPAWAGKPYSPSKAKERRSLKRSDSFSRRLRKVKRWITKGWSWLLAWVCIGVLILASAAMPDLLFSAHQWPKAVFHGQHDPLGSSWGTLGGRKGGGTAMTGSGVSAEMEGAQSKDLNDSLSSDLTLDELGLSGPLYIYVYDLPSSYNLDFLVNPRCESHLFAAEVALHRNLLISPVRTLDPSSADLFFVPVYTACNFRTVNGFPSLKHAPQLLEKAVAHVAQLHPYWNQSQGYNHVFVATHDFGACFHSMESLAVAAGIPKFLRRSIILQTFAQTGDHPCQAVEHIQIPPYVPVKAATKHWRAPESVERTIWAYVSGKIEVSPKHTDSGEIYGRGVRTAIWRKFKRDKRFLIRRKQPAGSQYYEEMMRSTFCLCPRGWAPWSPRIVESVLFGCIPVIVADLIQLPFSHVLDWSKFSVLVSEKDAEKLDEVLSNITSTRLAEMQHELWKEDVRRAVLFHQPFVRGDATWQVLDRLSMLVRSRSMNTAAKVVRLGEGVEGQLEKRTSQ